MRRVLLLLPPLLFTLLAYQPGLVGGWVDNQASLDAALKFALDLQLSTHLQDSVIDALLLPRWAAAEHAEREGDLRAELIGLSQHHGGIASPAAAAEVAALLLEREPSTTAAVEADDPPINAELTAALRAENMGLVHTLLRSTRPLTGARTLAVDDEPVSGR
jgi:hypothetical protein